MPFSFFTSKNNSGPSSCTPSSIANLFASTFASSLDDEESQPPFYSTSTITMSTIKFSTCKVQKILFQLNTFISNRPGIVFKSCAAEFTPVLNKLFWLSYYLGIFPSSWKLAHIFPILIRDNKSGPSNYHPIAITSLISKTMETIITKQLLGFLETNNLSDHQYGFQQPRYTGDLLAYAIHAWPSALESYSESRVTSPDVSWAFDHIWHKSLLAKLPMFNSTMLSLHRLLAFYLIDQLQLGLMSSSLSLIPSTHVCLRAQFSLLF